MNQINWPLITFRISKGDSESFGVYYDACFEIMLREARRLTHADELTCCDFVHNAMLKAMRSMICLQTKKQVEAWSRVVVRSVVYDWLRKKASEERLRLAHWELSQTEEPVEMHIEIQARLLWVEEQLKSTTPELRSIINMRYKMGWTLQRIAKYLGKSTGSIDGKIRRLLEQLRLNANEEYFDE